MVDTIENGSFEDAQFDRSALRMCIDGAAENPLASRKTLRDMVTQVVAESAEAGDFLVRWMQQRLDVPGSLKLPPLSGVAFGAALTSGASGPELFSAGVDAVVQSGALVGALLLPLVQKLFGVETAPPEETWAELQKALKDNSPPLEIKGSAWGAIRRSFSSNMI